MDYETDLSRYLLLLLQRWRWIVLLAIISAATAIVITQMQPPTYSATSAVFFTPGESTIAFDPRYISGEVSDPSTRVQGLLEIAQSPNIETQIPAEVRQQLAPGTSTIGALTNRIEVSIKGDLFVIRATGATAEQARVLADSWASGFMAYTNKYSDIGQGTEDIEGQVAAAEERYSVAQAAWEQFRGSSPLDELDQRIEALEGVLSDALAADQLQYATYLTRTRELGFVLRDAEMLRDQLQGGRPVGLGETLAALSLRARAVDGVELPIQLQFSQSEMLDEQSTVTADDLELFIANLRTQISNLQAEATKLGAALAASGHSSDSSLTLEQRTTFYKDLLSLRQQKEVEEGKRSALGQERDVALEALQVVQRKLAEEQVRQTQSNSELKLASQAVAPASPDSRRTILKALAGGVAGGMLAIVAIVIAELTGFTRIPSGRRIAVERTVNSRPSS